MHGFPGMWYLSVRIWNSWLQHKTLSTTCNNSIQFNSFNISGRKVAILRRLRTLLLQQALQGQTPQQPQQAQVCIKQIGWEKVQGSPWGDQIPSCSKKVVLCFCVIFWLSQGQETWTVCLRLPPKNELEVALLRKFDSKRFILWMQWNSCSKWNKLTCQLYPLSSSIKYCAHARGSHFCKDYHPWQDLMLAGKTVLVESIFWTKEG